MISEEIPTDIVNISEEIPTDNFRRTPHFIRSSPTFFPISLRRNLSFSCDFEVYPSGYSDDIFLGIFRGNSDEHVVLGISSEIRFLGIPSEIAEEFLRKNEIPRSYFRGLFSSVCRRNSVIPTTYRRYFLSVCRCFLVVIKRKGA
ncbi:hypothetical protein IGI04_015197 [Brassica rapa subsp. trilocularis]|uniref:Uncharacterized protein n=1 Tax=Brassica rapa subsp. trilocularis TaxID=1813537 RepID=A0ABQ7MPE5_BRACM|nr:hypothetical protein IGI04_015197 [Brassica rapa subsp. trilocularis]